MAEADRLGRVQALQQRRVQFLIGPGFVAVDVQRRQWEVARNCEQARLVAGRLALLRFREAQLQPGTVVPAWVEREFQRAWKNADLQLRVKDL